MSSPNSRALASVWPMATGMCSSRNHQQQRCAQTERGNSSLGLSAHTCVAGNDPQHDRSGNRAGFNGSSYAQTGGAMSRAFHCRSAAGISPHSRRPVLDTLLSGIGLNSPAERIRAARGAFNSVRIPDCRPVCAQLLQDEHPQYRALPVIKHPSALSSSLICWINKCQQARTNNCHSVTRGDG